MLAEHLRERWADALKLPLSVHEGYDLYSSGGKLTVGHAYLYELQALERLKQGKDERRLLRGLYFPTATPSLDLICQATLYFDEFYVIHPGSTIFSHFNRRYSYGDRDKEATEAYVESHEQESCCEMIITSNLLKLK